ncbi:MAG: hypothetical protein EP329_09255 [Deltaproteobacteria bacterium]|nr:MAG: hypothetical protein EP329_09255 [Deltaproteobacteria bacterium]
MKLTRDQLLTAMEQSYDYYSARAVLSELLDELGLTDKGDLDKADVGRLCDALSNHSRHSAAIAALREATGLGPAPDCDEVAPDDAAKKKAAAEKAAAEKAAAEKAAAEKAAAEKAAAEKAAAEKAAAEKAAAEKAAAEKAAAEKAAAEKAAAEKAAAEKAAAEKKAAEDKAAAEKKAADDKAADDKKAAAEKKAAKPANAVVLTLTGAPEGASAVLMVGDHALVGAWKAAKGLALKKQGDAWTGRLELDPKTTVEAKFVAKVGDGEVWENGDNRKLTAIEGELKVDASWQA